MQVLRKRQVYMNNIIQASIIPIKCTPVRAINTTQDLNIIHHNMAWHDQLRNQQMTKMLVGSAQFAFIPLNFTITSMMIFILQKKPSK